jgi:O-methyltransferase
MPQRRIAGQVRVRAIGARFIEKKERQMRVKFIEANSFLKGFVLFLRPGTFANFLSGPFLFLSNLIRLSKWISRQPTAGILNDFYKPFRDYNKRFILHDYVIEKEALRTSSIHYLEFGVANGQSFRWWLEANKNPESKFYGFDTFEGLPEDWGFYKKGDMTSATPVAVDPRAEFVKGLFQETLFGFLRTHHLNDGRKKVIHMDADLFSSTLFVLTSLAQYLNDGDVVMFDEFNVPNHEFYAFRCFSESYYVKTELIGAVNNFYQAAFRIVK